MVSASGASMQRACSHIWLICFVPMPLAGEGGMLVVKVELERTPIASAADQQGPQQIADGSPAAEEG